MLVLSGPRQSFDQVFFSATGQGIVVRSYQSGSDTALSWANFNAPQPRAFAMKGFGKLGLIANGTHIVAETARGLLTYALEDGEAVRCPSRAGVYTFACSPTEPLVVVRHRTLRWSGWRIGKKGDWKPLWQEKGTTITTPLFSGDGTRVFHWINAHFDPRTQAFTQGVIASHDPRTGKWVESVESLNAHVSYKAIVSPDSRLIAQTYAAEIVVMTHDPQWRDLVVLHNNTGKHFTGITFHPSGRFLGATSNDATVKLYDTTTWDVARTFTWDIGKMRSIAFSPDGTLAAAGSDKGKVVVWDVDL